MNRRLRTACSALAGLGLFTAGALFGLRGERTNASENPAPEPTASRTFATPDSSAARAAPSNPLSAAATTLLSLSNKRSIDRVYDVSTRKLLDELDPAEVPTLLEQLVGQRSTRSLLIRELAARWTADDPVSALAWARKIADAEHRRTALSAVVGTWAETDATAARRFVDSLPGAELRSAALRAIAWSVADHDPAAGIAILQSADGVPSHSALASLVALQASRDLATALRTIDALPVHISHALVHETIGVILREESPELAADLVLTLPPSTNRQAMLRESVEALAIESPATAIDWIVASVQSAEDRRVAVPAAIERIAAGSPTVALAQLDKLNGPDRNLAIAAITTRWAMRDPRATLAFAREQPDIAMRLSLLRSVSSIWSRADLTAAQAAAAQLPEGPERAAFSAGLAARQPQQ